MANERFAIVTVREDGSITLGAVAAHESGPVSFGKDWPEFFERFEHDLWEGWGVKVRAAQPAADGDE